MATDEDLVLQMANGDEPALRELLRRYQQPLGHFIHRHTGGADVEDIFQETWLRVVRNASRFDVSKRFSTWLFQIAVNLCRDWRRRPPPEAIGAPPAEGGATADLGAAEIRMDAARLLQGLPEKQREALILRYYNDLSEQETATVLDCPVGTVKSRVHGALARLADLIRREET